MINKIINKPYYIKAENTFLLYHPIHEIEGDKTSHNLPYFSKEKIIGQYNSLDELQSHSIKLYSEKAKELI